MFVEFALYLVLCKTQVQGDECVVGLVSYTDSGSDAI